MSGCLMYDPRGPPLLTGCDSLHEYFRMYVGTDVRTYVRTRWQAKCTDRGVYGATPFVLAGLWV
jgi:hypothetical protein